VDLLGNAFYNNSYIGGYDISKNEIADFDGDGKKSVLITAYSPSSANNYLVESFKKFNYRLNTIKFSEKHSYEFTYSPLTTTTNYNRTNFDYSKNGRALSVIPPILRQLKKWT
jgi:hypothetical protein